ncbi:MAG: hypothetical protein ABII89_05770 [Candidatus Omnitrophota bacterium]
MFKLKPVIILLVVFALYFMSQTSPAGVEIKNLPDEEKQLVDTTDPWGLAFSDQIARYESYFTQNKDGEFVVGVSHNLVKIWPNKYWFRGDIIKPGEKQVWKTLWTVTGSSVSFQVAILPKIGAKPTRYTIEVNAPVKNIVYREEYVKLGEAAYPRFQSNSWPDPLVPENSSVISGMKLGAFLVELKIPENFSGKQFACTVKVSAEEGKSLQFTIPVEVVKLNIQPGKIPLVAWFNFDRNVISENQFKQMYEMALENHLQPLTQAYLQTLWNLQQPEQFERFVRTSMSKGQTIFQINEPDEKMYRFLKDKNWLSSFMIYSNADEPDEASLREKNIPYAEKIHKLYPGLKIFLASEYYPGMEKACDIWMTDLSSCRYDPRTFTVPKNLILWHYYCHLPVNFQMRSPLTLAPNMMIDNPGLQHRLALWMSWHYNAKGVFIWSGNMEWNSLGNNFWQNLEIAEQNYKYPYGGIHHGNGFLVYPPKEENGPVLPSLRLKILRDGVEDIAIFEAAAKQYGGKLKKSLNPAPTVFVHPHYYDNLPETLLNKREQILKELRVLGL